MTVAWQAPAGYSIGRGQRGGPAIEGYLLELDDGCGGEFRVSITDPTPQKLLPAAVAILLYSYSITISKAKPRTLGQ